MGLKGETVERDTAVRLHEDCDLACMVVNILADGVRYAVEQQHDLERLADTDPCKPPSVRKKPRGCSSSRSSSA